MFDFWFDAFFDGCCGFNVRGDSNEGCGCFVFGGDEFSANDYGCGARDHGHRLQPFDCLRCYGLTERVGELGDDVGF